MELVRIDGGYIVAAPGPLESGFQRLIVRTPASIPLCAYDSDPGGRREPLIFAPPVGVPIAALADVLAYLAAEFRVITWDTRGYPSVNDGFDGMAISIAAHVDDLLAVREECDVGAAHIVGYCGGAAVALAAAVRCRGAFRGCALVCGAFNLRAVAGENSFTRTASDMFELLGASREAAGRYGPVAAQMLKSAQWDGVYEGIPHKELFKSRIHFVYEYPETLYRYARMQSALCQEHVVQWFGCAPPGVLVVYVADDNIVPPDWGRYAGEFLADAQTVVFPSGGHWALCKDRLIADRLIEYCRRR